MKKFILIITGFIALNVSAQSIAIKPYVINPNCYGSNNGSIELYVDGGIAPYSFSWNKGLPSSPTQTFLAAGSYEVTVTDNANNRTTTSVEIVEPNQIILNVSVKDVTTYGGNNGEVKLEINGGTPGYNVQWNNESTDQNLWDVPVGNYSVVVTDASGCTATASANVYELVKITNFETAYTAQSIPSDKHGMYKSAAVNSNDMNSSETLSSVVVYPNPATNVINVKGTPNESEITLVNMNGQVVSQQKTTNSQTQMNVSSVASGTYVMLVKSGNESTSQVVSIAK